MAPYVLRWRPVLQLFNASTFHVCFTAATAADGGNSYLSITATAPSPLECTRATVHTRVLGLAQ